jgi:glucokinase
LLLSLQLEIGLLKFLMKKFSASHRVSVERVVSGIGLANVCARSQCLSLGCV